MLKIMNVDNVIKLKVVVNKYPEMSDISVNVRTFMKKKINSVVKKEEWSQFVIDNPTLVTELLIKRSVKKKN